MHSLSRKQIIHTENAPAVVLDGRPAWLGKFYLQGVGLTMSRVITEETKVHVRTRLVLIVTTEIK